MLEQNLSLQPIFYHYGGTCAVVFRYLGWGVEMQDAHKETLDGKEEEEGRTSERKRDEAAAPSSPFKGDARPLSEFQKNQPIIILRLGESLKFIVNTQRQQRWQYVCP